MSARILALKRERKKLAEDARKILDQAEAESRPMSSEERATWDRHLKAAEEKGKEITEAEADAQRLGLLEQHLGESGGAGPGLRINRNPDRSNRGRTLKAGRNKVRIHAGSDAHFRCSREYRRDFSNYLRTGAPSANLQTDVNSAGGYLAPEQFVAELISEADDLCFFRTLARTFVTTSPELGAPSRNGKATSAAWGAELSEPNNDTGLKFGKRKLAPHYMTGQILVSRDLIRAALLDVDEIVMTEIGRDCDYLEESGYMIGDGQGKPLGLFYPSADGIPTSRDYKGKNTTTALHADTYIGAKYKLKARYRNSKSIGWIHHRDAVGEIAQLKDQSGRYIFEFSDKAGQPDNILGIPNHETEFAPFSLTASSYVGMLGDYAQYWIADALALDIQRLVETHAKYNQDAFLYRRKVDGMPILGEGFVRLKMADS